MASSSSLIGNVSYVPILHCNLDQLEMLHELKVDFANLVVNEFDFLKDLVEAGWFEYFHLEQEISLDVLIK